MQSEVDARPSQFFTEDFVERIDDGALGVVARTWSEQPELDPLQPLPDEPLLRPLRKGEIGVQFYPNGERQILPDTLFRLSDRYFVRGDFVKRHWNGLRSGVVLNVNSEVKVQHAITKTQVDQWIDRTEFTGAQWAPGDYVLCDDWVGMVEEVFNEAMVASPGGKIGPVYELGQRFSVGELCYSVLSENQDVPVPAPTDVVIQVIPVVLAISWSALNQTLSPEEGQNQQRPKQFWSWEDMHRLTFMRPRGESSGVISERVTFRDPSRALEFGLPASHHEDPDTHFTIDVDALTVVATRSRVEILWQDGTREWVPSIEVIPYINPDEFDCWPGDYIFWKGDEERSKAIGVVQGVSAEERIATVRWEADNETEKVPLLELDPHGLGFTEATGGPDTFGIHRGEFVLIHREGTTNSATLPIVPRIGEMEAWVSESLPMYIEDAQPTGWRSNMAKFGMDVLATGTAKKPLPRPDGALRTEIRWFGQVVDLNLDGNLQVVLPHDEVITVPLSRVSLFRDMDDLAWDLGVALDPGEELLDEGSGGSWEEIDEADQRDDWGHIEEDPPAEFELSASPFTHHADMPGTFRLTPSPEPPESEHSSQSNSSQVATSPSPPAASQTLLGSPSSLKVIDSTPAIASPFTEEASKALGLLNTEGRLQLEVENAAEVEERWKKFAFLPSVPPDHAFFDTPVAQPSKTFMTRLNKEYRVLGNSLPDSILVRAFEDRSDLLRCLIIGPSNTPYEDAPFVIDWRLEGTFPHSPPIAHFLSWTNGNGRVNPNLYEEGKVCLSILGTWAGDRTESWNPARSSLLQAFVSIQGLVLVKEPWYCEPAYEKLRGTEEGHVNSRLYNEKAYVLSRGFVRRALEVPVGGLEEEIAWLYYRKGRLKKVIDDAEALVERSEHTAEVIDAKYPEFAMQRLTAGGVISLTRILNRLRVYLHPS